VIATEGKRNRPLSCGSPCLAQLSVEPFNRLIRLDVPQVEDAAIGEHAPILGRRRQLRRECTYPLWSLGRSTAKEHRSIVWHTKNRQVSALCCFLCAEPKPTVLQ
jgi:hypothetical protein